MLGNGSGPPNRRQAAVIVASGAAGVAFACVTMRYGRGGDPSWLALSTTNAIGVCFLAAGLVAWWRRPANPVGRLMVAVGSSWYAAGLQGSGHPVLYAVGFWLTYLPAVIVAHLALVYPDGRFRRPLERWAVVLAYLLYFVLHGLRYLHERPWQRVIGWPDSLPNSVWANVVAGYALAYNALLFGWMAQRWRAASPSVRRLHAPVWLGVALLTVVMTVAVAGSALRFPAPVQVGAFLGYGMVLAALPFAFLSGLLWVRLARQRVADLVVALKDSADPARLRDLLSDTLGDPSLVLGFWSQAAEGYVDIDGRPVTIPHEGTARAVTLVEGREARLAALVHDPALAVQQPLVGAVVAAARLALEGARLQALLRAQLVELEASRARLAEAALNERRAIERDLHDGLQHRLLRLSWLAGRVAVAVGGGPARPAADQLSREARDAYATLRELAQGIHPAVLTEQGLEAAVEEHAMRSHVPMIIDIPAGRWAGPIEATAYFVILEAATNAAKHASAEQITVRGWQRDGWLTVEIVDDGLGGADPRLGTGLRGLRDRVTALGGRFAVHSAFHQGTRVVMELPCG
jgi:signal transduction histidine kinase